MGVVCSTSFHQSPPMAEHLARAIAARSDLFGYHPYIGDYRRGGFELSLTSVGDDQAIAEVMAANPDASAPVPVRADGAILLAGDTVRLADGSRATVKGFDPAADSVHMLLPGDLPITAPIVDLKGRWSLPTATAP